MSTPKPPHSDGNEETKYQLVVRTNQQETRFKPTNEEAAEDLKQNLRSQYSEDELFIEEVKR